MSRQEKVSLAAIGFRVKSGYAIAVGLAVANNSPRALDRRVVALSEPDVPESKQPYHGGMGILEEDTAKIEQRSRLVQCAAMRSVADLVNHYRAAGRQIVGAGLVVGSQVDPATIANTHIRAHALEGQLFRSVLEEAVRAHGVVSLVIRERDLYAQAAAALKSSEGEVKRSVTGLGRELGGPWRADEKLAATAAWIVLASQFVQGVHRGTETGTQFV